MKMTMNEYVRETIMTLPEPTTIHQCLIEKMVVEVVEQLQNRGEARIDRGYNDGNRKVQVEAGHRVKEIFETKGYSVQMYEYSEKTYDKYFWITIEA